MGDNLNYKIEYFRNRFFICNSLGDIEHITKMYLKLKGDKIDINKPYSFSNFLFDWESGNVLFYTKAPMLKKTFDFLENKKIKVDFSFLEPYKTLDKNILYQCDKVKPNINELIDIYAIDHIWLAFTYRTKTKNLRMCINSNLFGRIKDIGNRNFNLDTILLSLEK